MRIKYQDEEYQISGLKPKGNTIVAGHAVGDNGKLREGVEDITEYDAEGNEVIPLVFVNENVSFAEEPRPDSSWLVVDIKLWLDAQGVEYTSSMLKADLLALV
jgi:hypothetical protein